MLRWVLVLLSVASLPSIFVNPVSVFPPYPCAPPGLQPREPLQPFVPLRSEEDPAELSAGGSKDGSVSRSRDPSFFDMKYQQKVWRWPLNGACYEFRETPNVLDCGDSEITSIQDSIPGTETYLELRESRLRSCEALFSAPFAGNHDSAFVRRMASPGYVQGSASGGQGVRNVFASSSVISAASCTFAESLFLLRTGRASSRPSVAGHAHILNMSSANARPNVQRSNFVSSLRSNDDVAARLSVPEGAARLRQLSALMKSLREVQAGASSFSSPHNGNQVVPSPASSDVLRRVSGRQSVEEILSGFVGLKLMPPITLLPAGPAVTELKGDLVARLGGLSGRYEMSNRSHCFAWRGSTKEAKCRHSEHFPMNRGLSPGRAASVASGPVAQGGSIFALEQASLLDRRVHALKTELSPGPRRSWHAPRASTRRPTRPPSDEWLEDGDRIFRPLVPTLALALTRAAAKSAGVGAGAAHAEAAASTAASVFWAQRRPKMALVDYCDRLARFSACSGGAFLLAV
jgi:hypothetical protein